MPLYLSEQGPRSLFLAAASSLALLASLLSYSRSTLLATVVSVLVFLILLARSYRWRVLIVPLALLLLVAIVERDALLRFKREDINSKEHTSIIGEGTSRFEIWSTAWNMYLDNPIHGVGQHNFLWLYEKYAPESAIERYAAAHNDLLTVAATMGSIGLVAYLLIWLALLRGLGRVYFRGISPTVRSIAATGLILILAYLVMSQFEAFLEDEEVKLAILFLLGMVFSRMNLQS
jgi:O-antigen ligase